MRIIPSSELVVIEGDLITPVLKASTPLTSTIRVWELPKLVAILTLECLKSADPQQLASFFSSHQDNAEYSENAGGHSDLGGATFSSICTSGMRESKAQVGLLFTDGNHLSVEVNEEEFLKLQLAVAGNQIHPNKGSKDSYANKRLRMYQLHSILEMRVAMAKRLYNGISILLSFYPLLFIVNKSTYGIGCLTEASTIFHIAMIILTLTAFSIAFNVLFFLDDECLLKDHDEFLYYQSVRQRDMLFVGHES